MPFEIVLGKKYRLFQCPLNEVDPGSMYLIGLVSWSESMGVTPSGTSLFDEANWYCDLREFVLSENAQANEEFKPVQQVTPKQGSQPSVRR